MYFSYSNEQMSILDILCEISYESIYKLYKDFRSLSDYFYLLVSTLEPNILYVVP
jgi:hypothetical protein